MRVAPARPGAAQPDRRAQFAADVAYYLRQEPRQLPSRYLYDDLGSALFEAICRLPWYPLKRAEMRLLHAHGREILHIGVSRVIELGSGNGEKLAGLIASAPKCPALDVHLIDVSRSALADARSRLAPIENVRVVTHEATYEAGLEAVAGAASERGQSLVLLLGSNLGNFDPAGREALLRRVRAALTPGDDVLLGADLAKPERALLLAYDDPLGVTAAFNRNLLVRINRELGGTFDVDAFAHRAVWNRERSRVEMHLVAGRPQRVAVPAADLRFVLNGGDSIWTESSYKYDVDEIAAILESCGFRVEAQWVDGIDQFALTHAEAV